MSHPENSEDIKADILKLSIKKRMIALFFTLIFTFTLTVSVLVLQVVSRELKERTIKTEIQRAEITMNTIERYLLQIKNTAITILSDQNVEDQLVSNETDVNVLLNQFNALISTNIDNVFSIMAYDINEDNVLAAEYSTKTDNMIKLTTENASSGNFYLYKDHFHDIELLTYPCVLKRNFFDETIAYLAVNAHLYYMKTHVMPLSYSEDSFQFLLNDKNEIVFGSEYRRPESGSSDILILPFYGQENERIEYSNDVEDWAQNGITSLRAVEKDGFRLAEIAADTDNEYFTETVDGVKYLVLHTRSSAYGWTHIQYIPEREIFSSVRTIIYILMGATVFFTIVSLILAYFFSAQITRPIFKLTNMMENYKLGKKIDNKEMVESRNEFRYLFESYKSMIRRTEFLIDENFRMELNRKQTELKMVKSAIDPHFMYNILDSVHWLLKLGKTEKAIEVLHDFPRYLRNMLHTQEDFISVKSERETIENYCRLQRFFYSEKISHSIDIPEKIENYSIMPLLLQPIVENAYKYAFGEKDNCKIVVSGRLEGNVLEFTVTDNGKGIPEEELKQIIEKIGLFELNDDGQFFGLGSTDRRIKIQYGQQYGLQIESVYGEGTTVTITYPVI